MECRLDGKSAIITGGSAGIGKAIAINYVTSGANVAIVARRQETLDAAKDEIETYVHAEVGRRLGFVGLCAEDVDSYHTTIDWTRINLSGKRGRPKKAPKPIITNVPHITDGKDIIASLVEQAEYISEDEEEDKTIEEEEEIEVIKIKYSDDKIYYLDEAKNEVYDEGQLPIGQWNPDTQRIMFDM